MKFREGSESKPIYDAHNEATQKFFDENGRWPTSKDPEYWEISDAYKASHRVIIDARLAEERKAELLARKLEDDTYTPKADKKKAKSIVASERPCENDDCNNIVPKPARGRWPANCISCRGVKSKADLPAITMIIEG